MLRHIGRLLRKCFRRADLTARYGGEEFAVLLADTGVDAAKRALENLRETVAAHPWHELHADLRVTISIGMAVSGESAGIAELLACADERLYAAKRTGRNRLVA